MTAADKDNFLSINGAGRPAADRYRQFVLSGWSMLNGNHFLMVQIRRIGVPVVLAIF